MKRFNNFLQRYVSIARLQLLALLALLTISAVPGATMAKSSATKKSRHAVRKAVYTQRHVKSSKAAYKYAYNVRGQRYYVLNRRSAKSYEKVGIASWYGKRFHGRKTANGERYNMFTMTAASKVLPLGSVVRVTNLINKKTVVVRINDRGPFVKRRIIDLSYAAAKKLGYHMKGIARVKVDVIKFA